MIDLLYQLIWTGQLQKEESCLEPSPEQEPDEFLSGSFADESPAAARPHSVTPVHAAVVGRAHNYHGSCAWFVSPARHGRCPVLARIVPIQTLLTE